MTRRFRLCAMTVAAALSLGGCSHRQTLDPVVPSTEEAAVRCLYKVNLSDGEREGRFRLVLWQDTSGFRLAASDSLGRGLWTYEQNGTEGLWIDRRAHRTCQLEGSAVLDVEEFGNVPVSVVPELLRGRPVALPDGFALQDHDDGSRLTRDQVSISWNRGHCEVDDQSRPSLDRYRSWAHDCAVPAGHGE